MEFPNAIEEYPIVLPLSAGSVSGLRARGASKVAMEWKDGKLRSATIRNAASATLKVRCGARTAEISLQGGQAVRLNADLSVAD